MKKNKHNLIYSVIITLLLCIVFTSCSSIPKSKDIAIKDFNNSFSGIVLVVDNGKELFYRNYGTQANKDSKYRIGSISKTFVSAAIALLVDQRLITLEDKVDKYFSELKFANEISILNLLEHKSGIPDFSSKNWEKYLSAIFTKEDVINLAVTCPGQKKPSDAYVYSNVNYILLGKIVEIVSTQDFLVYIQENILNQLGMNNTGYQDTDRDIERLVPGICHGKEKEYREYLMNYSILLYCGGMYSTVNDLEKWCKEFANPKVLPRWYTQYPYGWEITNKFGHDVQYHMGNVPAYSGLILILRDKADSYYIVLSNEGNNDMNPSIKKVAEYYFHSPS